MTAPPLPPRSPAPDEVIDGSAPLFAVSPTTLDEAVDLIRWARAERVALVPCGGGTERPVGNRLATSRWVSLRTDGLTGIVWFARADTVVSVRPGTRLSELQAALAEADQFLPNDSPRPERATVGGIVACNRQGLLRPLYGTPRDRVLGMTVVTGEGVVVRAGGRTVKNVAGYDLCKLFTGSRGSLGLIAEIILRSDPLPESRLHLVYRAPSLRRAIEACMQVHGAHLQPAYMAIASRPSPLVAVGLLGRRATVDWQKEQIEDRFAALDLAPIQDGPSPSDLCDRTCPDTMDAPIAGRVAVPVGDLLQTALRLEEMGAAVDLHIPNGIVYFAFGSEDPALPNAVAARLPQVANLRWIRLPLCLKGEVDVFGGIRSGLELMRGIKAALDPDRVFSPGRFAGRL